MIDAHRRRLLAGAALSPASALAPALLPLLAPNAAHAEQRRILNDASRLNPTPVFRHWRAEGSDEQAFIARLRNELKEAQSARRPFAVGAARHSMGGQSLPRNGHALTNALEVCEIDSNAKTYRTHSGSRWIGLIRTLDARGFSPAVMQSNADFGTGGTLAVNAHGWPAPFGPFGATVRSFRQMMYDGSVVNCSRTENAELFGLTMGGYGLFGVILDLEVEMVENRMLRPTPERMPAEQFGARFARACETDRGLVMAYGRLSIARKDFLREAMMFTYHPVAHQGALPPAGAGGLMASVSREIFRAQIGSEAGKAARWAAEAKLNPRVGSGEATRNTLMNEPVANLAGRNPNRTDILHEYFVPPARFPEFLAACREVILASKQDLLNVTLRWLEADATSVLAYAPERRIAAVMLFSQLTTPEAEADMLVMTERLIERTIGIGGSFYLPYRLHARRDQIERAYPRSAFFVERKRHYDPRLVFRNEMWDAYFA